MNHLSFLNNPSANNKFMIHNGLAISSTNRQASEYIVMVKVRQRFKQLFEEKFGCIKDVYDKKADYYYMGISKIEKNTNLCYAIFEHLYQYSLDDMYKLMKQSRSKLHRIYSDENN